METIKRELFLCLTLTAFVFICALVWGSPFLTGASGVVDTPRQMQSYNGIVLRSGDQFLLRDVSGQVLQLDDTQNALAFQGDAVIVTGRLSRRANAIHVERIEPAKL